MKIYFMGVCGTAMGHAALLARAAANDDDSEGRASDTFTNTNQDKLAEGGAPLTVTDVGLTGATSRGDDDDLGVIDLRHL